MLKHFIKGLLVLTILFGAHGAPWSLPSGTEAQAATAAVTLDNLRHTYNGEAKPAIAITSPTGLKVMLTYDGSPTPQTNIGSYTVVGTVDDPNFQGQASGTLVIRNAISPVQVPRTGQTSCWNRVITGDGVLYKLIEVVPCAGTGQDAAERTAGEPWPMPRFTDNGNGTQTDNLTGLVWLKDVNCIGAQTFSEALATANALGAGSCSLTDASVAGDWRVPNRTEMLSLVNYQFSNGATWLQSQGFIIDNTAYWTSSQCPAGSSNECYSGNIWVVDVNGTAYPGGAGSLFPVRDGKSTSKAAQAIIFNPPANKTFGDPPFDLSAYATGGASGNPVTFAVTSGPGSLNGSILTITGAGIIQITASQAGNASYSAAPDVLGTITAGKANATITLSNLNQTYDCTSKSVTATTDPANIGYGITYTEATGTPAANRINPGVYNVVASINDPNYQGSATGAMTITKLPPAITGAPTTQPNINGWYDQNVTVHFTATDACSAALASVTPDVVITTEGSNQAVTGKAFDIFGNSSSFTVTGINIDKTAPLITISGISNGATYNLGLVPPATYTVDDALSGVAASNGILTGGDSQGLGQFAYTVTATDTAGNSTTTTAAYTVIATPGGLIDWIKTLPLDPNTSKILIGFLEDASTFYADGKLTAGDNKMGALINQLNAPGRDIPSEIAGKLKTLAEIIITQN